MSTTNTPVFLFSTTCSAGGACSEVDWPWGQHDHVSICPAHTHPFSLHTHSLLISAYIYTHTPSLLPLTRSDPNTLFRGNSLASKVIDEFMKLVGKSYLQQTLQFCIDEVNNEGGGGNKVKLSLSPRPKATPGVDCFQYSTRYTGSNIRARWGLGTRLDQTVYALHNNTVILKWEL